MISTKLTYPCRFACLSLSLPLGSAGPPGHVPSSVDILAVFERELSMAGH